MQRQKKREDDNERKLIGFKTRSSYKKHTLILCDAIDAVRCSSIVVVRHRVCASDGAFKLQFKIQFYDFLHVPECGRLKIVGGKKRR